MDANPEMTMRRLKFILLKAGLIIGFLFSAGLEIKSQTIFRQDKPVVQALWHRMADYSPTLRSVESAEISPREDVIVSASKFGNLLKLWRVDDGFLIWSKELDAEVEAVTFSPDGKYIASGDEAFKVTIFDLKGEIVKELMHNAAFDGITWSPDGKYVAAGTEKGEVVLWNSTTWEKERILDAGSTVNSLQFTRDVKSLIVAGNKAVEGMEERMEFVKWWSIADWNVVFDTIVQKRSVKSVRLSPDEKLFAISGFANQVKVFQYPEMNEIASFDVPERLEAIAFHPEGNFLFAGGQGENMHVYSTKSWEKVSTFPCNRVEYIHFSKDGRLMVTGHEDSGLLSLYMLWSKLTEPGAYQKLSREILKNKDMQ